MTEATVTENVTCLGCGCACDDIAVGVRDGRIVEARNACSLGVRWFGDGQVPTSYRIDGSDAALMEAIMASGTALGQAARPFVYLASGISCESQRAAAAIADLLRGGLDSLTSSTAAPFVLASQEYGHASATLGEIRNRADVVVFWATDVESRYPRFSSRYAPDPVAVSLPLGRRSRTVIAVDVGGARATVDADHRIAIDPAAELATLTAVEALSHGYPDVAPLNATLLSTPWPVARELTAALLAGRYIALVYDAEPDDRAERSAQRFSALASLAQSLNGRTRCAAVALRAGGNRSGADFVLAAQTGYPFAVDYARGYPQYDPSHHSALTAFARHEVDVALIVGDPNGLPQALVRQLADIRTVVIGPRASEAPLGPAHVVIDTGADGIHSGGTAMRMDDVPLPLRATLSAGDSTADVLRAIGGVVRNIQSGGFVVVGLVAEQAAAHR